VQASIDQETRAARLDLILVAVPAESRVIQSENASDPHELERGFSRFRPDILKALAHLNVGLYALRVVVEECEF
jgi:hypothetical protein